MKRSERIKRAYEYLRFQGIVGSQDDVANKMKRQRTNVSSALNGNEKYLTDKFVKAFCKTFSIIDLNWLLTGEGAMLNTGDITQSGSSSSNNSETITTNNYAGCGVAGAKAVHNISNLGDRVSVLEDTPVKSFDKGKPYYNVDFVGGFDVLLNDQTINPEYLIDFRKYEEADLWCNITGHSMEPLISNGDIIALKTLNDWKEFILYGEVYGIVTKDMRTVKVVTRSDKGDGYFQLVPINKSEEYRSQDIPLKLITHVFKVLGCMKKL